MSDQTTTIDVLHIDDDENQLFYTRQILEQFDPYLTVHSVLSSADVFDRLQLDPYDCLITDYLMPGMNGIEFAEKIRETSNIPIIIYTGRGSEEVASNAFNVGVNDYIRKETDPNHYQILARRIRAAVNKKRAEERVIQERNRAQRYLDVAGAMIVVLDVEGRISLLNQKGCEILE
ncbi:MAG: response regulator, partial [Candidatus Bathyarchaeota archaeon]